MEPLRQMNFRDINRPDQNPNNSQEKPRIEEESAKWPSKAAGEVPKSWKKTIVESGGQEGDGESRFVEFRDGEYFVDGKKVEKRVFLDALAPHTERLIATEADLGKILDKY
jgi:hypothetical protein